ncbi:PBP1A family penicillin-binding protein [Prochlorococcus sp. MIT 1307]|uniref:transglycosylase domain-containing protein n=1 Tax=Prochlorococcus sp. MIT 1307 TaxID=3096219 RepID=UPI002A755900|nr:PBP1A family penicillin-binding protein [Prochlorococcus sp. MIT 1307]
MSLKSQHWLLVATISFLVGSLTSISEIIFGKAVDSFLPDAEIISNFRHPRSITLLSTNNKVIQKIGPTTREKVATGKMPSLVKKAFVAAEDRRFYEHKGVDLWGISRALFINLAKKEIIQGGSTITQQLTRTVFLNQDKSIIRKLKEAALAYKLERQMTKNEILEQYLNNVYLGSGAYGIADAAWVYFSKTPGLLKLEEIALIAGLAPAPSLYSPIINPDLAIERRSIVLKRMRKEGFINKSEFLLAINSPLHLKPATPKYFNSAAPFFTSWVYQRLLLLLTPEQLEIGGLKIRTSLNLEWQRKAQEIITKQLPNNLQGAIVSIQPRTGLVRVMVGGTDFYSNQFNRATQALRSPGSTFKIFPYAAALSVGLKPEDNFIDAPRCWNKYCPKNFGDKYMGKVSLSEAFKNSLNTIAVELLEKVGFEKVISTANSLGIGHKRPLGKYYPLAIGAYEQTVLDMTAAYAGVANRGVYIKPTPFEEIRGPKNTLLWSYKVNHPKGLQVLKVSVADKLNRMLEEVVSSGTGKVAYLKNRPVAGKTGTSEGGRDLWFIGSIPQLSTGVWLGYDNNKETRIGSGEAAWVWKQFILQIERNLPILTFPKSQVLDKTKA